MFLCNGRYRGDRLPGFAGAVSEKKCCQACDGADRDQQERARQVEVGRPRRLVKVTLELRQGDDRPGYRPGRELLDLAHGQDVLAGIVGAGDDDGIVARGDLLVVFGPDQVAVAAEGLEEGAPGVGLPLKASQELCLPARLTEDRGFVIGLAARDVGDEEIDMGAIGDGA